MKLAQNLTTTFGSCAAANGKCFGNFKALAYKSGVEQLAVVVSIKSRKLLLEIVRRVWT